MEIKTTTVIERAKKFGIDIYSMGLPEEATLEQRLDRVDNLLTFISSECEYILTHVFNNYNDENKKRRVIKPRLSSNIYQSKNLTVY